MFRPKILDLACSEPVLITQKFLAKLSPVGLPLSRGTSIRVRSTTRGGRSPSAPSKPVNGVGLGVSGVGAATPGRGRRSRSVSKVGIKLGAYNRGSCVDALLWSGSKLLCLWLENGGRMRERCQICRIYGRCRMYSVLVHWPFVPMPLLIGDVRCFIRCLS